MAVCGFCNGEMTQVVGCSFHVYSFPGLPNARAVTNRKELRCHDCGAEFGYYHHPGCDMERCPWCHGQFITCDHRKAEIVDSPSNLANDRKTKEV